MRALPNNKLVTDFGDDKRTFRGNSSLFRYSHIKHTLNTTDARPFLHLDDSSSTIPELNLLLLLNYASTPTNKLATDFGDHKPTSGNSSQST